MSNIRGGGIWLRLQESGGLLLNAGSIGGDDDVLFWQVFDGSDMGPILKPSANGAFTPDSGSHTIKVVIEGDTFDAYVDGKLATTITYDDMIAAGRTPPTRGVVGLFGPNTSTRFDRIRIWGKKP